MKKRKLDKNESPEICININQKLTSSFEDA